MMNVASVRVWVLCCTLCLVAPGFSMAAEPAEQPKYERHTECSEIPFLSTIPYVNRLFRIVGVTEECEMARAQACPAFKPRRLRTVDPDGFERIGIDFDCEALGAQETCQQRCAASRKCTEECVEETEFDATLLEALSEARVEMHEALEDAHAEFRKRESQLLEKLFEARLAAAVAHATLQVRDKAAESEAKLRRELLAAHVENTRLQAKLELAEAKAELAAELHQARADLATLKAQSERANHSIARPDREQPVQETARKPVESR